MESLFIRNEPYKDEDGNIQWRLKGMQATQVREVFEVGERLRFEKVLPVDLNKIDESLKQSILGAQLTAALNANEILTQENKELSSQLEAEKTAHAETKAAKDTRITELEAALATALENL